MPDLKKETTTHLQFFSESEVITHISSLIPGWECQQ